jgi:hypothetical protein
MYNSEDSPFTFNFGCLDGDPDCGCGNQQEGEQRCEYNSDCGEGTICTRAFITSFDIAHPEYSSDECFDM